MAARYRKWAEAQRASPSEMRGPCVRGEVMMGGWGHPEQAITWASSSIPWQYYCVRWVGKTKEFRCSDQSKKWGEQMAVQKERRARHLTCAVSYVHAKTPLYAFPHSSLHLRLAMNRVSVHLSASLFSWQLVSGHWARFCLVWRW